MSGGSRYSRSGETAKTLILIGLILQVIEVVILLGIGLLFIVVPFLGAVVFGLGVIGTIWVLLVYWFSYKPTSEGDFTGARTPTLVLAIISLLTFGLISGILYVVAYAKLADAEHEGFGPPPGPAAAPLSPGLRFCATCGRMNAAVGGFCQSCGARLS